MLQNHIPQKLLVVGVLLSVVVAMVSANDFFPRNPHANGGHDCECYYCQQITETKKIKKTVYTIKNVPFCLHQLPGLLHHGCCPECECQPRFKKVLVKKEVVVCETCIHKCTPVKAPPCEACLTQPANDTHAMPAPVYGIQSPTPPVAQLPQAGRVQITDE